MPTPAGLLQCGANTVRGARQSVRVKHCDVWFTPETFCRSVSPLYVVKDACISRVTVGDPACGMLQLFLDLQQLPGTAMPSFQALIWDAINSFEDQQCVGTD